MSKIILLSPNITDINDIKSFSSLYAYYIIDYFNKHNVLYEIYDLPKISDNKINDSFFENLNIKNNDNLLALGLRFFSYVNENQVKILRNKTTGKLCQLYDTSKPKGYDLCDITFSIKNFNLHDKSVYINWSADDKLLNYKNKSNDVLNIIIDHPHYSAKKNSGLDKTDEVTQLVNNFINNKNLLKTLNNKYNKNFKKINAIRLVSNGIEKLTGEKLNNISYNYNRVSLKYVELLKLFEKSHIYIVTHNESIGINVIESAMAGNLILTYDDYIKKDRIDLVNHSYYDEEINWDDVFSKLDSYNNYNKVSNYTYDNSIKILLKAINKN